MLPMAVWCAVTPSLPMLPMAVWCAVTPALSKAGSIAAPISIAFAIAFVQSAAEAFPGFVRARLEFQLTCLRNGYEAVESLLAASPIASAYAGAAPKEAAVAAPNIAAEPAEPRAGGTKVEVKKLEATRMAPIAKQHDSALLFDIASKHNEMIQRWEERCLGERV